MSKLIFAGDSWALKGYTPENYNIVNSDPLPGDTRLADHWPWRYDLCVAPGKGNLTCLAKICNLKIASSVPIVWVFTEPGRDYALVTGRPEFEWIESENIFEIRKKLEKEILYRIRNTIPNPIGLIGGLSDVDVDIARLYGFEVLYPSWQQWIATTLSSKWFNFGWGASDIGWHANYNNARPSKAATFAWDEQIKEWCWWEEQGYFCHEHPSPRANQEFAYFIKPTVEAWLKNYE